MRLTVVNANIRFLLTSVIEWFHMCFKIENLATRLGIGVVCVLISISALAADPKVSDDKIVFGQAADLEGSISALGIGMRDGLQTAFDEINKSGGIKGRKLELISKNDDYDPAKSAAVVKSLIANDKVFGIVGVVGTPTAIVTQPIAAEAGVPFIGAMSGAALLREPDARNISRMRFIFAKETNNMMDNMTADLSNVINLRASYGQETENLVAHLTTDLGAKKIAVFYQDDGCGQAGLAGVKAALDRRGMKLAAEGFYQRNTTAVKTGLLSIRDANPDAVILVGPYAPSAEIIKLARQLGITATFASISFVDAAALIKASGPAGAGVIISQVMPLPTDVSVKLVANYQKALAADMPGEKPSHASLEGYADGVLIGEILKKMDGELTRDNFVKTALTNSFDLGGFLFKYTTNHQGSDALFLTVIQPDGTLKQVENLHQ